MQPARPRLLEAQAVTLEHLGDALQLERQQRLVDAALAQPGACGLEHQHLGDVDRRKAAADHQRIVDGLEPFTGPVLLVRVIEPDDERILVHEAAADVRIGAVDRERPVAPCPVGQDYRVEAPAVGEVLELDVAADAGVRHEVYVRVRQLGIDRPVFLAAQLVVPARQTVLDLSVRPRVLLEHRHERAGLGEPVRHLRPGRRAADHGDRATGERLGGRGRRQARISSRLRHGGGALHSRPFVSTRARFGAGSVRCKPVRCKSVRSRLALLPVRFDADSTRT
ncbi:MAG: hypothetical protein M5U32_04500 [Myxococcota bacterium]|nr:hypothetical protein [Myxococcota bacterium]